MNTENKPKAWIITGWVFSALYVIIGFSQLGGSGPLHTPVGISALICAALFGIGAYYLGQNNAKSAKICWIVGGILGLPLGLVMLIGGLKLGKTAPVEPASRPSPVPEAKPTVSTVPAGAISCPACGHGFTPPRITMATQAVIDRYGPNPVQCPGCKHIWSR
ncbi:MAG: hypothetical protein PSU94_17255 [Lacunisphaera sp.]|nr:hypothetical protein [Lacunisphaera sp.]